MEYRSLKIKVISAVQCLKNANLFSKMDDICCQVSIVPGNPSQKSTHTKPNCWMEFVVHETYFTKPGLFLLFQIKNQLTDKEIGHAAVPLEQLFPLSTQEQRVVEYQATSEPGREMGFLKFAYILVNKKQIEKLKDETVQTCNPTQEPKPVHKAKASFIVFVALCIGWALGLVAGHYQAGSFNKHWCSKC